MRAVFLTALFICTVLAALLFYQQYPATFSTFSFFNTNVAPTAKHVVFTGDVFLGRAVERWQMQTGQNPFQSLKPQLAEYQYVVTNFESAVPKQHVPTPDYTFRFSVANSALPLLPNNHITHASLANNHSFDFGAAGWQHSREALQQVNVEAWGHPYQVASSATSYLATSAGLVAVVAINAVGTTVSVEQAVSVLQEAVATARYTIVYIHWGEEYQLQASNAQQELAAALALPGVRAIIGHHPHVVQPVTQLGETLVFYSLGNTIFDQYFSPEVQTGLLTSLEARDGTLGFALHPISSIASRHRPTVVTGEVREAALAELASRSHRQLQADIVAGFIPLP